jgi:hypothetical protein
MLNVNSKKRKRPGPKEAEPLTAKLSEVPSTSSVPFYEGASLSSPRAKRFNLNTTHSYFTNSGGVLDTTQNSASLRYKH